MWTRVERRRRQSAEERGAGGERIKSHRRIHVFERACTVYVCWTTVASSGCMLASCACVSVTLLDRKPGAVTKRGS